MMNLIIEPFFLCLLASMIWAPMVFLLASRFRGDDAAPFADKLWPAALLIAALPALIAPIVAALGLSLRNPPPLPPMSATSISADYASTAPAGTVTLMKPSLDLAEILTTAAGLYFYGFILFLMLGAFRMIWFSYRVQFAYDLDERRLEEGLEEWRRRMELKRAPRYAFTDAVSSVCVHGFFRPIILMPMSLLDRVSVNDAILMGAHEMAHIKRGDTWLFAYATAVKAIFWFNPFIHRIAARANLAAEQAADALVIARGASRKQYAHCFVEGLRFAAGAPRGDHALVPSFTPFDKRSRRERLDAILSKTGGSPMLSLANKIGLTLSIIAAAAVAFAQAALAVAPKPPEEALPETPVEGRITSEFGSIRVISGESTPPHNGVDVKAPRGTAVRAAGDGKVIDATKRYKGQTAWGNVVVIDHGHGLITRYAHLDSYTVKKGDRVAAGEAIGAVGSTGKATGPHLHFEVIQDGANIDPAPVIVSEPMPAPKPRHAMKSPRAVKISAPPVIATPPLPTVAPVAEDGAQDKVRTYRDHTMDAKLEKKLAGKRDRLEKRLRGQFQDLDGLVAFKDFEFGLGDLELEAQEAFEEFAENMGDLDFHFDGLEEFRIEMPEVASLSEGFELSDAGLAETRRAQAEVRRAKAEANREVARAKREAKAEANHAQQEWKNAQRERERARRNAERDKLEAERERAEAIKEAHFDNEEMLALREQALDEAQAALEKERAEIERIRAELNRQKRERKSK